MSRTSFSKHCSATNHSREFQIFFTMTQGQEQGRHTFLVTGASSGLGLAIALEALSRDHRVIGTSRSASKAAARHLGLTEKGVVWTTLDVTDSKAQAAVESIVQEYNVDVLVNNAGYGLYGGLEDMRYMLPGILGRYRPLCSPNPTP
jgi:NAD(P)-dependent dehydrogenase (short-subunit alcohol dehydrogenase family)